MHRQNKAPAGKPATSGGKGTQYDCHDVIKREINKAGSKVTLEKILRTCGDLGFNMDEMGLGACSALKRSNNYLK